MEDLYFRRQYRACRALTPIQILGIRIGAWRFIKNPDDFLEDVWKTPGRRGHLSHNSLEDTDPEKNINYLLYFYSDSCLPRIFARGVHVFQVSSRRLPRKYEGFDNAHNVDWKTAADIAAV